MPDTGQGMPRRLPPRYPAEIREIERLTPRVVRLLLGSPELAGFQPAAPGSHIKLILPPPGSEAVAQPIRYDGGRPVFADGVAPPFLRTYTPLRFNPARHELEVEMLDHGDSPASNWTRRAEPGQRIIVAGPRGGWKPPPDGDWYLVMADDTGIPAAVQVLQALAGRPRAAIFEATDAAERRPLPGIADSLPQWLYRETSPRRPGQALDDAVRRLQFPAGRVYVWMALESGAMRRIRRYLMDHAGLPPEQMITRGYWKLGAADHPDGDYGDP